MNKYEQVINFSSLGIQDQWKRGQPVLVGNVHKSLTKGIWNPEAFCEEFGHIKNDLVNCRNGHIMHALPMTSFWNGFANMDMRLVDKCNTPLVLKLKVLFPQDQYSKRKSQTDSLPSHTCRM